MLIDLKIVQPGLFRLNPSSIRRRQLPAVFLFCLSLLLIRVSLAEGQRPTTYYPGSGSRDNWERRKPEQVGMGAAAFEEAISFAKRQIEPKSVAEVIAARQGQESHPEIIGLTKERGGQNGLVLRQGYIVAEWGETDRVDMIFSATKSFLSAIAGLAFDRGLIQDIHGPVKMDVNDGAFDSPHNAKITWEQFLQQTSEWEGSLWAKPHTIDEPRSHTLQEPGTFWCYNDVRVNRLSLSLLRVWKKPLPQVLKEELMDPIGASNAWQWHVIGTPRS
jgi:CubicO group peptidase (beta-lactamase class C family)